MLQRVIDICCGHPTQRQLLENDSGPSGLDGVVMDELGPHRNRARGFEGFRSDMPFTDHDLLAVAHPTDLACAAHPLGVALRSSTSWSCRWFAA